MTAKKTRLRHSLILSVMSLVLCFAMLIGTTYAWFTDTVTSGTNSIVAGNLDIEVEYSKDGQSWASLQGKADLFDDVKLWEPGAASVVYLKLTNKGTLALKYNLGIKSTGGEFTNVAGEQKNLKDALQFAKVSGPNLVTYATREEALAATASAGCGFADYSEASYMSANDVSYISLVVAMPTSIGNEFNPGAGAAPQIALSIDIVATQYSAESDSFGKYYDVTAEPIDVYTAEEFAEAAKQAADGSVINVRKAGLDLSVEYSQAKTLTLKGEDINKLTVNIPAGTIHVYNKVTTVEGTNVDLLNSAHFYNRVTTLSATAGHFVIEAGAVAETIIAAPVVITDTEELKSTAKELKIEVKGAAAKVTAPSEEPVKDVDIKVGGTVNDVEIPKADTKIALKVEEAATVTKVSITDTDTDAKIVLQNDGTIGNESDVAGKAQAIAGIDTLSKTLTIKDADDLRTFAKLAEQGEYKQYTVEITNDIDLAGKAWTPINAWNGTLNGMTINGNNHTIKNMTAYHDTDCGFIQRNASSVTIKDLTFDNAKVSTKKGQNQSYAGVLMGKNYSTITIENVNVKNSSVVNNWQCGGLVGFSEGCVVSFKNCSVSDTSIGGYRATAGSLFGLGDVNVNVENCTSKSVTLYTDSLTWDSTAKADNCFWAGHLYSHALTATGENSEDVKIVELVDYGLVKESDKEYTIISEDGMAVFANNVNEGTSYSGKTVKLACDIDLSGITWTPIGKDGKRFEGTFDGQNHTIKNLTSVLDSTSKTMYGNGLFGDITGGAVLKNFTVDNAVVKDAVAGKGNVYGIVCGYAYGNVTFENITVKNSSVSAFGKVAAILGMAADAGGVTTVKNCKVENTSITGAYNCAPLIGLAQNTVALEGNTQSDVSFCYSVRYGAECYTDVQTTNNSGDEIEGHYWKYTYDSYYAAWADLYNEQKESTIESGSIGIDAIVHNK